MTYTRKYGSLFSPSDLRDFVVSTPIKDIALPTAFELNSTTIKNQGYVNSCVAHTLSSLLESIYKENYSTRLDLWLQTRWILSRKWYVS